MTIQPDIIDANYVITCLEDAGATQIAMRVPGCYPAGYKSNWPDIVREFCDFVGGGSASGWALEELRPAVPSAAAITRMDEVFGWVAAAIPLQPAPRGSASKWSDSLLRRVVLFRAAVHPITGIHLRSWRHVARILGSNHNTVKIWHSAGIDMIVKHVNGLKTSHNNFPEKIKKIA